MDGAAVVVCGAAEIVQFENDHFTSSHDDIAVRGKTIDTIVSRRGGNGVIEIEKVVAGKVWIESDTKQTAFATRIDIQRDERRRQKDTILNHAQAAALLANEDAAVRRDLHGGWIGEPGDRSFRKARRQRGRVNRADRRK